MTTKTYSFEDGKYQFDRDTDTHRLLAARRHGEPWTVAHADMQHAKFFHAMLNRIDELEAAKPVSIDVESALGMLARMADHFKDALGYWDCDRQDKEVQEAKKLHDELRLYIESIGNVRLAAPEVLAPADEREAKRDAAERTLEILGYSHTGGEQWRPPLGPKPDFDLLDEMRARKDAAYLERNQVVAALASAFPSGTARTAIEGWSEDWHGCVYINLPTGQASWHYHDSQAHLFAHLPPYAERWDGHSTEEKYRRLAALVAAPEVAASTNLSINRYCRAGMCVATDEQHEPDCPKGQPDRAAQAACDSAKGGASNA